MNTPTYEIVQGIRAVRVSGAEDLLRQGEYYVVGGQLVIKCPSCGTDNLAPKTVKVTTTPWYLKIIGIEKGLTIAPGFCCWRCQHGVQIERSQISISNGIIKA